MSSLTSRFIPDDFWHGIKKIGPNLTPGEIGGYYNDLSHKTKPYAGRKSEGGIPLVEVSRNQYALHPVTVCQVGLGWYERWLTDKSRASLECFLKQAEWLQRNAIFRPQIGAVWPVPYSVPYYGLSHGWISSLVQGQALSVLVRAYKVTNDDSLLKLIENAIQPLTVEISSGGLLSFTELGKPFFEEYPSYPNSRVLNGFISTLWGIYDSYLLTGWRKSEELFRNGFSTLESMIQKYDIGYWSRYSLFKDSKNLNLASPYYHREHIEQLKASFLITKKTIFFDYSEKWEKYSQNTFGVFNVVTLKSISKLMTCISIRK